ncbi:hypothetical protein, partial [Dokdonella sp.]|uniref:hypothetical protein n=1 Tax=Dokdonella sp. TaxID=2291710 RepID=UPI003C700533
HDGGRPMSFTIRNLNKQFAQCGLHWGICITLGLMIAPATSALAEQTSATELRNAAQSTRSADIDPVTGLVYGTQSVVSGVAMTVDAEGHPRALCADPADSLAPLQMRDAIDPRNSRIRYE